MKKLFKLLYDLPVYETIDASRGCKILAWLLSIVAVCTVTGFVFVQLSNVFFIICAICLLYIISKGGFTFNSRFILLYIGFALSALFCFEPLFNSRIRFVLFLFVTLTVSSCIESKIAVRFRLLFAHNLLFLSSLLVLGSFVCFFIHVNFMPYHRLVDGMVNDAMFSNASGGWFSGLFCHSMQLGPFSSIVALIFLDTYLEKKTPVYIVFFFMAAMSTIFSASRAATASLVLAIIYLLLFLPDKKKYSTRFFWIMTVSFLAVLPIAEKGFSGLQQKQQGNIEAGGTLMSRSDKFNNRIEEFLDSPIWGQGFCAVNIGHTEDYASSGGTEPGSSHLAVLSMTGLLGFIPYILILFKAFTNLRGKKTICAHTHLCLLIAILVHSMFEGYVLAAGGMMCWLFWLLVGQCYDNNILNKVR